MAKNRIGQKSSAKAEIQENLDFLSRRSQEYAAHVSNWRWLLDSYEGGDRYRYAVYKTTPYTVQFRNTAALEDGASDRHDRLDAKTFDIKHHNLIRHPREYPDPREPDDTIDDFATRLERTPVPTFVSQAVNKHLARIYAHEVDRKGTPQVEAWWQDVNGCSTTIDKFLRKEVAPLLLTLGQLDLIFDHPSVPDGETVETKADEDRLGLSACVCGYILPENLVWWKLDQKRQYVEVLVREQFESDDCETVTRFRHWTAKQSRLFDEDGTVLETREHPFGRVPIRRVFDVRKLQSKNIGQSRYEGIAARQKEAYNAASEFTLTNTIQAHPVLQGPEKYLGGDKTVPVGPGRVLPTYVATTGTSSQLMTWSTVEFPKDGAQFLGYQCRTSATRPIARRHSPSPQGQPRTARWRSQDCRSRSTSRKATTCSRN